jgi:hypothetical protein
MVRNRRLENGGQTMNRFYLLLLSLFFSSVVASLAQTDPANLTISGYSIANISFSGNVVSIGYQLNRNTSLSPNQFGEVGLRACSSQGDTTPSSSLRFATGSGGANSGTLTYTLATGQWYYCFITRTPTGGSSLETKYHWFKYGGTQTVTVTPVTASVRVGGTVNLTASGGQNGYNWSATNGGSLAYTGSNAGFTASTAATYIVQVWSPAGNSYSESNYATATITVGGPEKVSVKLPANNSGRPIDYIFVAAGQTIGTETQNIGAPERVVSVTLPASMPSGTQVTVLYKVLGIQQDEVTGSWSVLSGAVTQGTVATLTPSTDPVTVGPNSPDFIGPKLPDAPKPTDGAQTSKPVWSAPSTNTALTDAGYREGVDKTTGALSDINSTLKARLGDNSGSGSSGDTTSLNTTMAGISDKLTTSLSVADPESVTVDTDTTLLDKNKVTGISAKLPTAPVITHSGSTPTVGFKFVLPRLNNSPIVVDKVYDVSEYSSSVNIIRNMSSGIISILFFFVYVRTIKSAFAGT